MNLAEGSMDKSLSEVHESVDTRTYRNRWQRFLAFLGPAYLVSVGYMDPGNWATDIAAGSKYGYSLLWVLLMSNLMALVLQSLSARLGIVTRTDLAQANRLYYPKLLNQALWLLAEIAIAATDLAEVLGMAIGLHLLFDMPILLGVFITLLDTFLLLYLQRLGIRKMELFIIGLIFIIGISFLINLILAAPDFSEIIQGFIPSFPDAATLYKAQNIQSPLPKESALYLAIGIIGATVMPHNLYLHSALVQTRKIGEGASSIKKALRANFFDTLIALNLALLVNGGILVLSAATFFKSGLTEVGKIEEAYRLLAGLLGNNWAPKLFAIALIAAGQSSTITGTLAGQIVMEGYLQIRLNPWVRRLITRLLAVIPAVLVIYINGADNLDALLILSQVILSAQLGFAVIPLIHFVSDKEHMGAFSLKWPLKIISWVIAVILVSLNVNLLWQEVSHVFASDAGLWVKLGVGLGALSMAALLGLVVIYPMLEKRLHRRLAIHSHTGLLQLSQPQFNRIAISIDFSSIDSKVISFALAQGHAHTQYLLIHVLESTAGHYLGGTTGDLEAEDDKQRLEAFRKQLSDKGFEVATELGFGLRKRSIAKMVNEFNADLLVMGSHGHRGLKDIVLGTTVDDVRHLINIPVLVVK